MAINVQGLQGHWNQLKGEVMKRWENFSEDDLKWSGGNIDQLVGRIQQRTGETREAIEKCLDQLTSQGSSAVSSAVESVGSYAQEVSHRLRDHYGDISEHARKGYVSARNVVQPQSGAVDRPRLRHRCAYQVCSWAGALGVHRHTAVISERAEFVARVIGTSWSGSPLDVRFVSP